MFVQMTVSQKVGGKHPEEVPLLSRAQGCPMGLLGRRGLPGMPGSKSHRRFLLGLCGPFPCSDQEHDSKDDEDDHDIGVDT